MCNCVKVKHATEPSNKIETASCIVTESYVVVFCYLSNGVENLPFRIVPTESPILLCSTGWRYNTSRTVFTQTVGWLEFPLLILGDKCWMFLVHKGMYTTNSTKMGPVLYISTLRELRFLSNTPFQHELKSMICYT